MSSRGSPIRAPWPSFLRRSWMSAMMGNGCEDRGIVRLRLHASARSVSDGARGTAGWRHTMLAASATYREMRGCVERLICRQRLGLVMDQSRVGFVRAKTFRTWNMCFAERPHSYAPKRQRPSWGNAWGCQPLMNTQPSQLHLDAICSSTAVPPSTPTASACVLRPSDADVNPC